MVTGMAVGVFHTPVIKDQTASENSTDYLQL